jgi:1-acyl-sn-glycerol-3-phosphate acyltransferase
MTSALERIVNSMMLLVLHLVFRVEAQDLRKMPRRGPGLLITNHTSNLEGPIEYLLIRPRPATALGKKELWKHWYTRVFMNLWGVIPLNRGEVDTKAMREAIRSLDRGYYLGIAPEGTRSKTGVLRRGLPGVALLATRREVPVYPVVQDGFLDMGRKLKQFRRPTIRFRLGRPFVVRLPKGERTTASLLRAITDEIMIELARLLPENHRGPYTSIPSEPPRYLTYIDL